MADDRSAKRLLAHGKLYSFYQTYYTFIARCLFEVHRISCKLFLFCSQIILDAIDWFFLNYVPILFFFELSICLS